MHAPMQTKPRMVVSPRSKEEEEEAGKLCGHTRARDAEPSPAPRSTTLRKSPSQVHSPADASRTPHPANTPAPHGVACGVSIHIRRCSARKSARNSKGAREHPRAACVGGPKIGTAPAHIERVPLQSAIVRDTRPHARRLPGRRARRNIRRTCASRGDGRARRGAQACADISHAQRL
ncbi:hypothetical protein B0H17DRAFT_1209986 [Mycena rosella]|uniref:Uncharacterized protein n=1 Tax=Mycena rosella TaxID=1033263 RepID=A0AAD7CXJ8_MYCRO|nr:hypothetical protein B0H17DRAFT_1209986 [Mycena rosella]